jgi:YesN/AraC family two-component response regulator
MINQLLKIPSVKLTPIEGKETEKVKHSAEISLIAIGVAQYPIRRLFISQLRQIYPDLPILILRREELQVLEKEHIRGEFVLSDLCTESDFALVRELQKILPMPSCQHTERGKNYNTISEVVRIIVENYTDPNLDLNYVARKLPISAVRLSRILNQQAGVSFRQLLRNTRIEEAKRMLASSHFSVKEVAARVGFSDSHYFSRSFKEITGQSASEFKLKSGFLC